GPRRDFVAFIDGSAGSGKLGHQRIGRLELMFLLEIPTRGEDGTGNCGWEKHHLAAIRPTEFMESTEGQKARRTFKVSWATERLVLVPLRRIVRAVSVVPILPPHQLRQSFTPPVDIYEAARGFVINNRIDSETFNAYF
ncbi:hypothetical protein BJ508DRAFT_306567, partial [Ascobolus immersus RN42]